jgi:hypothetical protein
VLPTHEEACHHAQLKPKHGQVLEAADPTYWALYVRNARVPVRGVELVGHGPLLDRNGWVFAHGVFDWRKGMVLRIFPPNVTISLDLLAMADRPTAASYRGGIMIATNIQT